jgi:hypothetical protein
VDIRDEILTGLLRLRRRRQEGPIGSARRGITRKQPPQQHGAHAP